MSINFTQVLQDSWNFFRNQQRIMLQFVAILFVVQNASALFSSPNSIENNSNLSALASGDAVGFVMPILLTQVLTSFIAAWELITIHKISHQNYRTLSESFSLALRRFLGVAWVRRSLCGIVNKNITVNDVVCCNDCRNVVFRAFKFNRRALYFYARQP